MVTTLSASKVTYNYDWAIRLNRVILKIFGLWPYSNISQWRNIIVNIQLITLTGAVLCVIVIPQILALIKVWGNIYLVADNLLAMVLYVMTVFKLSFLRYRKDEIGVIFDVIHRDWMQTVTEKETNIMVKFWSLLHIIILGGLISTALTGITYHTPLAFGIVIRTVTNLTDVPGRLLPFSTSYPFDVLTTPQYQLVVFSQVASGFIGGFGFTVSDTLFGMSVLHACAQLENLANRVEIMGHNGDQNFTESLKDNIKDHVHIIRFIGVINDLFSTLLLIFFMTFCIIFCMQGFILISVISSNLGVYHVIQKCAFFIIYSVFLIFHIFMYCWAGQILVTQSEELRSATYRSCWHYLRPKEVAQITLILLQTQRPLTIYAGHYLPVTLNTFTHLLKTSGGYISVLLAIKD